MTDSPTLATISADHFRPLIGQTFQLELTPGKPVAATLAEVDEKPQHRRSDATRAPFSVLLRVPADAPLAQGTYPISHAQLGRFELFMTPLRPDSQGPRYEIVFG
jgi:hypothetical protein